MATLYLNEINGGFSWYLEGLGNYFNTDYYLSAGIALEDFTEGTTTKPKDSISVIDATSSRKKNTTPKTNVYYDAGEYTLYAWCQAANGAYYHAASEDIVIPYFITLDHEGGDSNQEYVAVLIGYDVSDLDYIPERQGYRFLGYYTQQQNSQTSKNVQYYDEDGYCVLRNKEWSYEGNITIFAYWEEIYTITLDHQGGDGDQDSVEVNIGYDVPDLDYVPEKDGYKFIGYFTQKQHEQTSANVQYYDKDGYCVLVNNTWNYEGNITIYAYWEKLYSIKLDHQGGSNRSKKTYVYVGIGDTVPDLGSRDIPTKSGYVFLGYYTQKQNAATSQNVQYYDQDGDCVLENNIWSYEGDITIYAYWKDPTAAFSWTYEKVQDKPFNLTADEWNDLCDFVNEKRSTAYSFTVAVKDYPFTAAMYNEMVDAIGKGTEVKKGDPVTADLMNELVTNANNM